MSAQDRVVTIHVEDARDIRRLLVELEDWLLHTDGCTVGEVAEFVFMQSSRDAGARLLWWVRECASILGHRLEES